MERRTPGVSLALRRGSNTAPPIAPMPTEPSRRPYPPDPRCKSLSATSGSSAQMALAKKMSRAARRRMTRSTGWP